MKGLHKVGGISAIALGISYIIITILYVLGGALPSGGEEWLKHLIIRVISSKTQMIVHLHKFKT